MKKLLTLIFLSLGTWYISSSGYMLAKAELSQFLIKQAWEETLKDGQNHKPWSWADTYPVIELNIPAIDKTSYILEGASGRNMAFSAAHLLASGMPGQDKTTILSGHRDSHFAYLQQLNIGDKIITKSTSNSYAYQVVAMRIINSKDEKLLIRNKNELILTTCYPFNAMQAGGDLRYVIYANPV